MTSLSLSLSHLLSFSFSLSHTVPLSLNLKNRLNDLITLHKHVSSWMLIYTYMSNLYASGYVIYKRKNLHVTMLHILVLATSGIVFAFANLKLIWETLIKSIFWKNFSVLIELMIKEFCRKWGRKGMVDGSQRWRRRSLSPLLKTRRYIQTYLQLLHSYISH